MTYRNITTFASILSFVFGLGFILMPAQLSSFYNVTLNEGGVFVGQLFGAALIGFGVLNWFGRQFSDAQAKQTLVNANLVSSTLGFLFSLYGQLSGLTGVNALGWTTIAFYLLVAAGFAYLRFVAR